MTQIGGETLQIYNHELEEQQDSISKDSEKVESQFTSYTDSENKLNFDVSESLKKEFHPYEIKM